MHLCQSTCVRKRQKEKGGGERERELFLIYVYMRTCVYIHIERDEHGKAVIRSIRLLWVQSKSVIIGDHLYGT